MRSTITDTHTDRLVVNTCWCGVRHAIPSGLSREARENGKQVFCPMGHTWVCGKTEAQILRDKLDREKAARAHERSQADQRQAELRDQRDAAERSARGHKGAHTRTKNRVRRGVCPCCNRHFENLQRHMDTKHPDLGSES